MKYTTHETILAALGTIKYPQSLSYGELGWPQCDEGLAIEVTPQAAIDFMGYNSYPGESGVWLLQDLGDRWFLSPAPTEEQAASILPGYNGPLV